MSLGATFNATLVQAIGVVVGQEALAKHWAKHSTNALSFFAPNINIVRDVRWGRAQETYGEDPTLTGKLGTAYVMGMQYLGGDTSAPLAVRNVAKHFAGSCPHALTPPLSPPLIHPLHFSLQRTI
jgi:beta-glucosidase